MPTDDLFTELLHGRHPVTRIGDCLAPSSIADAVYSGHRFAREFGDNNAGAVLRRERPLIGSLPMAEPRERRRAGRPTREVGGIIQSPWKQLSRPYAPIEILSADNVAAIHNAALTVLEEIGMRVLEPRARAFYEVRRRRDR